jgi:uncharacterized membrane protein
MKSAARIANHPIHPMLILIPAGAFIIVLLCDLAFLLTGDAMWWEATPPVLLIGVAGALLAAIPGVIDYVTIVPRHNARMIGLVHMLLNVLATALFAANAWMRYRAGAPPPDGTHGGLVLTLIGNFLIAVSGWLGGTMVYEHHVGVLEHPAARDPDPAAQPLRR